MKENDFLERVYKGRISDIYRGLITGLERFDNFTNFLQKETYTAIGGMKKTGKTAFLDFRYVLMPYLLNKDKEIKWFYYSFEISRIKKMAKFASFIIYYKYGKLVTPAEILSMGTNKLSDDNLKLVEEVYRKELVDLFGVWDKYGNLIKEGKIKFIENKVNPTGIRNDLLDYFKDNGENLYTKYKKIVNGVEVEKKVRVGYKENNPNLYTIIIVDHVGLLKRERGFSKKDNIDKLSEYLVEMRNIYKATCVVTSQFNRDLSRIDRLKFSGEFLQPTAEDFKDTGNLAEDVDLLLALFNPFAYKHIKKHLGYNLSKMYKKYISLHLLESRDTEGFVDLGLNFIGACGFFTELPLSEKITEEEYKAINNNNLYHQKN